MNEIRLKRIYDAPEEADGFRVLVDRLWPRGVSKKQAAIDLWMKEVAPSTKLRKWFHHESGRWEEFVKRYREELGHKGDLIDELRVRSKDGPLTLVYSARNEKQNQAVVLKSAIEG
ncbi:uncharacterized protein YeaO (DUF488 family) [Mesorhizobium sp. J18]|uniref:DUF488 domain-containing protein n=1 Tax=Mesorhizobium sp. J18 TaxID=935263 RepID=UPI00119983BA|nr:DUF488 domain-containing protein [Mesorhizobium sp. J18]TWH01059.1 uncharacterized protein YeaO (DUF488 family) [Mesorhizobium sp. J18]